MNDQNAAEFVNQNFIATFRQVALFKVEFKSGSAKKAIEKQGGNIIGYFCTPEGRVLNFFVGPVQGPDLFYHAKFAHDLWQQIRNQKSTAESRKIAKDFYKSHINQQFEERMAAKKVHRSYVAAAVNSHSVTELTKEQAQWRIHEFSQNTAHRYTAHFFGWKRVEKDSRSGRLKYSALYDPQRIFWLNPGPNLLAAMPLPRLLNIEKPMFELLAREKYDPPSHRALDLVARIKRASEQKKCVMLISTNDGEDNASLDDLMGNEKVAKLAQKFLIAKVSDKELFHLLASTGNKPLLEATPKRRYHLFSVSGKLEKSLPPRKLSRLYYDMKKVAR